MLFQKMITEQYLSFHMLFAMKCDLSSRQEVGPFPPPLEPRLVLPLVLINKMWQN